MINYEEFAKCLSNSRFVTLNGKQRKRSWRDLASNIGVSYNTLSRIDNGKPCDLDSYVKICNYLNVSMDKFRKNIGKITPLNAPWWAKCAVCGTVYPNHSGSTPCCSSVAYVCDEQGRVIA